MEEPNNEQTNDKEEPNNEDTNDIMKKHSMKNLTTKILLLMKKHL